MKQAAGFFESLLESGPYGILTFTAMSIAAGAIFFAGFYLKGRIAKTSALSAGAVSCIIFGMAVGGQPAISSLAFMALGAAIGFAANALATPQPLNGDVAVIRGSRNAKVELATHVGVFGSTGSGKTKSIFSYLMAHTARLGFSSCVFDYKNGELAELYLGILREEQGKKGDGAKPPNIGVFYPSKPGHSDFFNPIDPKYISIPEDVESAANNLFENLYPSGGGANPFFKDTAQSAFAGVVWKLYEDLPGLCNLPYACATILMAEPSQLIGFLKTNTKARVLSAPFIGSAGDPKLMGSIYSSMVSAVKKISTPNLFYVLRENRFDLGINKEKGNHLILVNDPVYDGPYLPVMATICSMTMRQCSERGRERCVWFLDEASTLKFKELHKVLATLRTFKITMVWGIQDKVQGALLYSMNELKAILANLGTKLIGRASDIETRELYSRMFGTTKRNETTITRGKGTSRTTRKVDKPKYKPEDFKKLRKGQFFFDGASGEEFKTMVKMLQTETAPITPKNGASKIEIDNNFNEIMDHAMHILSQKGGEGS